MLTPVRSAEWRANTVTAMGMTISSMSSIAIKAPTNKSKTRKPAKEWMWTCTPNSGPSLPPKKWRAAMVHRPKGRAENWKEFPDFARLTPEISGRCRVPHDHATLRRTGPLERIVRARCPVHGEKRRLPKEWPLRGACSSPTSEPLRQDREARPDCRP